MLGRETNRAALAERQMRSMAAEMVLLRTRIAELESLTSARDQSSRSAGDEAMVGRA